MGAVSGAWGQTARPGEQARLWEARHVAQAPREAASHGGEHSACERHETPAGRQAARTRGLSALSCSPASPQSPERGWSRTDRPTRVGRMYWPLRRWLWVLCMCVCECVCTSACVPACTRVLLRKVFSGLDFFKTRFGTFPDSSVG